MSELNCKEITNLTNHFKSSFNDLVVAIDSESVSSDELETVRQKIETELKNIYEKIGFENQVIYEFRQRSFWNRMREAVKEVPVSDFSLGLKSSETFKVSDQTLEKFWRNLLKDEIIQKNINRLVDESKDYYDINTKRVYSILNAKFIDELLLNNSKITIKNVPDELKDYFGTFLKRGVLNIDKVGNYACSYMKGGVAIIGEAGNYLDYNMSGGTIIAKKAGREIGVVAIGLDGDGTVLCENFVDYTQSKNSKIIICTYKQDEKVYWKSPERLVDQPKQAMPMVDDEELVKARERKAGLYIIDDIKKFTGDVTDDWEDGILVLRDLPEKNIGKGMKGGAVIIESSLLPDKVCQRLSTEDRTGGVILMRVPDSNPDNPNSTKLIDLEDDWLEKPH